MTAQDDAKLGDVPFQITDAEKIPSKRYYDKEFFELEREKLWPHVWQMACRLEEIKGIGDYVEYRNLDKSVIVVRTKNGVKAFHNACRHRGVQLASGSGNCKTSGFICPFHGWRWNMEGVNTFVYGKKVFSEEILDKAEIDLVPCRVEFWGGCAFINFDDDAPSLLDCLGPVAERLNGRHVDELKMEWWYGTVLPTNWKLAMEAFMEGYHTMRTHPQLNIIPGSSPYGPEINPDAPPARLQTQTPRQYVDLTIKFVETLSNGMAGMIHPSEVEIARSLRDMELPDDVEGAAGAFYGRLMQEITDQGRAKGLNMPDLLSLAGKPFHAVEFMFPHYFLLPFFGAMSSYRIRPLTEETCLFEIWSLAILPEDENRAPVEMVLLPHDSKDFPPVPRQDYDNLPLQQLGLHAGGFDYLRLSQQYEGMISNHERLIDGYLAGLDPQKLAAGSRIVNSGFDAPILDIGFGPGPRTPEPLEERLDAAA